MGETPEGRSPSRGRGAPLPMILNGGLLSLERSRLCRRRREDETPGFRGCNPGYKTLKRRSPGFQDWSRRQAGLRSRSFLFTTAPTIHGEGGLDNLIWRTAVAVIKNPRFHGHPGRISLQETVDRKRRSLQERQRIDWRRPGHITTQKRDLLHRLSRQRVDRHAIDCVGDPENLRAERQVPQDLHRESSASWGRF